jgi:hypothetical protein
MSFTIEMLPAQKGDCLWIEYGDPGALHRLIIDGGTSPTFRESLKGRIQNLPPDQRRFDLLIVTHIDIDHIGGVLKLLENRLDLGIDFDDVWFNAFIDPADLASADESVLGFIEGEILTAQLGVSGWSWNGAFDGRTVCVPEDGPLPSRELPGGMVLTLISPGWHQVEQLRGVWDQAVRDAGLIPGVPGDPLAEMAHRKGIRLEDQDVLLGGEESTRLDVEGLADSPFESDRAVPNASSIAVIAEFDGRRCLLAGDAYSPVIESSLRHRTASLDDEVLPLDAIKMPHHGSAGNITNDLLRMVSCSRYLFSTNGANFGKSPGHPDDEAVARVLYHGRSGNRESVLYFNYRSDRNAKWDNEELMKAYGYSVRFPPEGRIIAL